MHMRPVRACICLIMPYYDTKFGIPKIVCLELLFDDGRHRDYWNHSILYTEEAFSSVAGVRREVICKNKIWESLSHGWAILADRKTLTMDL